MSRSSIAGNLLHSALQLRQAETTSAPVEHFPGNNDIVGQSACQVADMGPTTSPTIPDVDIRIHGKHEDYPVPRGACFGCWKHPHA